jgi:hypothetical protein
MCANVTGLQGLRVDEGGVKFAAPFLASAKSPPMPRCVVELMPAVNAGKPGKNSRFADGAHAAVDHKQG